MRETQGPGSELTPLMIIDPPPRLLHKLIDEESASMTHTLVLDPLLSTVALRSEELAHKLKL